MIACPTCGSLMPERRHGRRLLHCSRRCVGRDPAKLARLAEIRRQSAIANRHVDDVVVSRLMAGDRLPSTRAERIEAVAYLTANGRSALWIATQMHITTRGVFRYRAELNRTTKRKAA